MKKKSYFAAVGIVVSVLILGGAGFWYLGRDTETPPPAAVAQSVMSVPKADRENQTRIVLSQKGSKITGNGAQADGQKVKVTKGGTYLVSGTLEDGQILIDAGEQDTVILLMNGAELTNSSEAVIQAGGVGHLSIQLEENSENKFQSGKETDVTEAEVDDDAKGAAVYSHGDLSVTGTGSCKILGYLNNGIQAKGNLLLHNGTLTIEACNHAVKGKDSVEAAGGKVSILSGGDGMKSDNTAGGEYGNILITAGDFTIKSSQDAIQAENTLQISGGSFEIVTGGGSAKNTYTKDKGMGHFGMGGRNFGDKGDRPQDKPDMQRVPSDSDTKEVPSGVPEERPSMTEEETNWDMSDTSEESRKGFKSGKRMVISGGTFLVDSYDDAFHSNGDISIAAGDFSVASGDDGIHADEELSICGGMFKVTKSYEGLEGNQITIDNAEIEITATDDGVNAYGGQNSMGGGQPKQTDEMPNLEISGGSIIINADGDGLDSNGNLLITGGNIVVNGPENSGNGAIDVGSENGGSCTISGGTIIALGSSGMAEGFTEESKQCSFLHNFSTSFEKGSKIIISDSSSKKLYQYTAKKAGSSIVFSCPELEQGKTYVVSVDGQEEEITMDSVAVSNGGSRGGFGRGMRNGLR